jgi:nitrogen fixation NifU-like protein
MSDASAELYQAVIDDHRRRPRNRGPLPSANRVATRENPLCGDVCTLHLQVEGDRIVAARFTGAGCALSQASASLATVALAGLSPAEALALAARIERLVRTGDGAPSPSGDLAALSAAHALPARHACALLPWQATLAALSPPPPQTPET